MFYKMHSKKTAQSYNFFWYYKKYAYLCVRTQRVAKPEKPVISNELEYK